MRTTGLKTRSARLALLALLAALPLAPAAAGPSGIAVVVARDSPEAAVDHRELALIYRHKKRFWPDGLRVTPVNLPDADAVRRAFSVAILGRSPDELDEYWRERYFHGELPPYVAGSPEAVIRLVASTPGAIGYVPSCIADGRVSVLLVIDAEVPCTR